MRACWLKWVGRDWSISADYIWLNYSDANTDDSYFSFARQFVNGMISLRQLQLIMRLGDLGIQYALMSERAFSAIRFREWRQALGSEYYPKRFKREQNARRKYLETVNGFDSEGVYIRDLMTGRIDLNDPRVNGLWAE